MLSEEEECVWVGRSGYGWKRRGVKEEVEEKI